VGRHLRQPMVLARLRSTATCHWLKVERGTSVFLNGFGAFLIAGFCNRNAFRLVQLCEECPSPALDRQASLIENRMSARWHRSDLGFIRACFCERTDAVNHLLRIEAALAGEPLPVPPLEVVAAGFAGDLLREVLGDVFPTSPHMTSYIGASDVAPARIIIE
jgi:hypothetical protein